MAINNWIVRLIISFVVFLCVSLIVVPHWMDVQPPFLVRVLLWPAYLMGPAIGRMLPRGNIGTAEHPVYEGTPIDLLAGFALMGFSIFFYPVATFVVLLLVSRIQGRRDRSKDDAALHEKSLP
jgi:hypothetical protein